MPARNIRYRKNIPAGAMPDGWRYRLEIRPAHADPYDATETIEELDDRFLNGFITVDQKGEESPIGAWDGAVASVECNLGPYLGTPLYDYLTDDGQEIDYAVKANTVWILTTDGGNESATEDDWDILFIGVQRDYVGNDITGRDPDDLTISIDLVDISKVAFEAVPIWESGDGPFMPSPDRSYYTLEDRVRSRVDKMGGATVYGNNIRDRAFELLYVDADDNLYCVVHLEKERKHEYVFVKWEDVLDAWEDVVAAMLNKLLRVSTAGVIFRWLPAGAGTIGAPTDGITLYEEAWSDTAVAGAALSWSDVYICAWVRERTGSHDWSGQRIFGGAIWGKNVVGKEYTNLWDWYKDLTECSLVRGTFDYGLVNDVVTLFVNWTTLFSATHESPPLFDLGDYGLAGKPKFSRGGNAGRVVSAVANIADPAPKSESEYKQPVDSSPQSLKAWDCRLALHNIPVRLDDADHYFIRTPAPTSVHVQHTAYDTDFTVTGAKIIAATSGMNLQCFYYFPNPTFYTGSEPSIAARVHHKATFNAAGFAGTYPLPDGTEFQLPTWDSLDYPDVPADREGKDTWLKAIRPTLTELGRRGWPAYAAHVAAVILGRGEIRKTIVSVRRSDLHFGNQGGLQVVLFHPSDLIAISSETKPRAVLTALKQDIAAGVDEITLFNYYVNT